MSFHRAFTTFASGAAKAAGSPWAFVTCLLIIVVWAVCGPVFGFSDTWQLIINTGTTIVTFLMVFLIQNTQNRDGLAIQAKLDELILTSDAENEFIGIEKLTDKELRALQARCAQAAVKHRRIAEKAEAVISNRRKTEAAPARRAKPAPARRAKPARRQTKAQA